MIKFLTYDIVFQEIPNEVTLAFNITNCPYNCEGCHSPELRENIGEILTDAKLKKIIFENEGITCVCMMGGLRSEVKEFSFLVRNILDLKYAWYSPENILLDSDFYTFDYVKLGKYEKDLGGLKNPNTNQRLYKILEGERFDDITHLLQK